MYVVNVEDKVDKKFLKLGKKDSVLLRKVWNKIRDIQNTPYKNYKFLKGKYKNLNRVHIADHFVLIFEINHENKIITIWSFKHHDEAYK